MGIFRLNGSGGILAPSFTTRMKPGSSGKHDIEQRYGFENPFKPDPLTRQARRYLPPGGELLDAGCGEGADSAFLAQMGFHVTAIDKNTEYVNRFRRYCRDKKISNITLLQRDITRYHFPPNRFDVVVSLLAICCMKRSRVETVLQSLKRSVKRGGVIVISARNYLDPELRDYLRTEKMIEPNTFRAREDCCKYLYFIERGRLRQAFSDFQLLYYYEGYAACKYGEHAKHGDSYIICRRT